MPTPAYIDTSLYLPLGGINGFELNGFAVNGVGFVDSPFAVGTFALDPYRSILPGEPQQANICAISPSYLGAEHNLSVQRSAEDPPVLWAARSETTANGERQSSSAAADKVALELQVESISMVPFEYRTSYVLADHPASITSTRAASDVDELPPSESPSEETVSTVPAEYHTSKVRRI